MKAYLMRAKNYQKPASGFTIVEILIVIAVIGILAAVTAVSYNGITNRAAEVSMKSDLQNAASVLELDKRTGGNYPFDASSVQGGKGLKASDSNVITYVPTDYGFCVFITNPRIEGTMSVKSSTPGEVLNGNCDVVVSTLAGSGVAGFVDGTGVAARFNNPREVAVDDTGTLYVADNANNRIRKITPAGVVSTLAGSGVAGGADGTGTAAQFSAPYGIAVDATGTLYVVDSGTHRIRKITPSGVVSTLAGSGVRGYADGAGAVAQFNNPIGVAVDASGVVYVVDNNNHRIRKITPTGVVSTLAGSGAAGLVDGAGATARFNYPSDIAVDNSGVLYVADWANHAIRKITPSGTVSTLAGTGVAGYVDGIAAQAQFNYPYGVAVSNSGIVYSTDAGRIRKITPAGVVSTFAGDGVAGFVDGAGAVARFGNLAGMTVDNQGALYLTDMSNQRIRKIVQ